MEGACGLNKIHLGVNSSQFNYASLVYAVKLFPCKKRKLAHVLAGGSISYKSSVYKCPSGGIGRMSAY